MRALLVWAAVGLLAVVPLLAATQSPLLAWRDPVYIAAGFAGIAGFALLLIQPVLAGGLLPGLSRRTALRAHRWVGASLVLAVILHVAGLWITTPPDVIDALLLRSPTPFSVWGVLAMWAIFAAALLAASRKRLRLAPRLWRRAHLGLAVLTVGGTVLHAVLIEGTMGTISKWALCAATLAALGAVLWGQRWGR